MAKNDYQHSGICKMKSGMRYTGSDESVWDIEIEDKQSELTGERRMICHSKNFPDNIVTEDLDSLLLLYLITGSAMFRK